MYNTKKMINLTVRDDNNKVVDWYNIDRDKANDLLEKETFIIDKIHKVDQLVGREHQNLHTELDVITVRA